MWKSILQKFKIKTDDSQMSAEEYETDSEEDRDEEEEEVDALVDNSLGFSDEFYDDLSSICVKDPVTEFFKTHLAKLAVIKQHKEDIRSGTKNQGVFRKIPEKMNAEINFLQALETQLKAARAEPPTRDEFFSTINTIVDTLRKENPNGYNKIGGVLTGLIPNLCNTLLDEAKAITKPIIDFEEELDEDTGAQLKTMKRKY